jgi:ABC-type branched-subunit amino acid transport system substrate-binding protein
MPFRVGFVLDWGIDTQPLIDLEEAIHLAFRSAHESGVIDRPVDLFVEEIEGRPYGDAEQVHASWERLLRDERCIVMIGPLGTDNVMGLRGRAEDLGVALVTTAGALEVASSPNCFTVPCGTFADNGPIMANWLAAQGAKRVGVVHEANVFGDQYYAGFALACRRNGLEIAVTRRVGYVVPEAEAAAIIEHFQAAGADALAYMGWGTSITSLMRLLPGSGWNPLRIMSDIYSCLSLPIGYGLDDVPPAAREGWAGIDFWDEGNPVFARALDRFEAVHGRRPAHCYTALGWDLGNTVAEALALAPRWDRDGVRRGLEQVRMLPAALGRAGNVIGFAPGDRRAYKGEYVVVRQIRDGRDVPSQPASAVTP